MRGLQELRVVDFSNRIAGHYAGKMLVDAIGARDYPLAQGAITVFTMIIIVVNLVVDLLYAVVDPRITFR